jgi:hypothetical protein
MEGLASLLHAHGALIECYLSFWILSAAVSSLPLPTSKSGPFYLWLYRFLQSLCASLRQVRGKREEPELVAQALAEEPPKDERPSFTLRPR